MPNPLSKTGTSPYFAVDAIKRLAAKQLALEAARAGMELSGSAAWRRHLERLEQLRISHLENMAVQKDEVAIRYEQAIIEALKVFLNTKPAVSQQQVDALQQEVEGLQREVNRLHDSGLIPT